MSTQVPSEMATLVALAWKAGKTISDMQGDFGVSRQTLANGLRQEGVDPRNWRERNRAVGKPVGPTSSLKTKLEGVVAPYMTGASLASLASDFATSRSSVRRALTMFGVLLRPRGRPVKGLPRPQAAIS